MTVADLPARHRLQVLRPMLTDRLGAHDVNSARHHRSNGGRSWCLVQDSHVAEDLAGNADSHDHFLTVGLDPAHHHAALGQGEYVGALYTLPQKHGASSVTAYRPSDQ